MRRKTFNILNENCSEQNVKYHLNKLLLYDVTITKIVYLHFQALVRKKIIELYFLTEANKFAFFS